MATLESRRRICKQHRTKTEINNDYHRRTQRFFIVAVSKIYDQDVLQWLEANRPYQTAIKWLIRGQIVREQRLEKQRAQRRAEREAKKAKLSG